MLDSDDLSIHTPVSAHTSIILDEFSGKWYPLRQCSDSLPFGNAVVLDAKIILFPPLVGKPQSLAAKGKCEKANKLQETMHWFVLIQGTKVCRSNIIEYNYHGYSR